MSKDKAPMEYWLCPEKECWYNRTEKEFYEGIQEPINFSKMVKAIEFSAYAALEEKLAIAIEALEYVSRGEIPNGDNLKICSPEFIHLTDVADKALAAYTAWKRGEK